MTKPKHDRQKLDVRDAISMLIEQSRSRPVVPFLGSGFSFASGFPTIAGVIEYLAKVDFAVQFDLYKHRYPHFLEGRDYKEHPSYFIEDFGWPSISDLNAEIWNWLARDGSNAESVFSASGELGSQLLLDISGKEQQFDGTLKDAEDERLDFRDALTSIVQWSKRRVLSDKDAGTKSAAINEWKEWKKWYFGKRQSKPELLGGDWDEMLERICEGNLDLVDSLFTSFEKGRQPTLAHRYLAFLADKLSMPLVLTTNFDSFLEASFRDAGIDHRVFDIHRDASLPHISLVKKQLSLLKLHGSAYGLRVGERLAYPVESNARESIVSYLPEEPLIVVAGFSGSERRMTQMLKTLATDRTHGERSPRMLWLEGPGERRPMLKQLADEVGDQVSFTTITDISTFLQQAFFIYSGGYQSSHIPYQALPGRPALRPPAPKNVSKGFMDLRAYRKDSRKPIHVFSTEKPNSSWAGLAAAQFASARAQEGYSVIWIDMEKHHTVPGTVAEILQKARNIDPGSPTFSLFSDKNQTLPADSRVKAVKRIHEILKHGRYVLVLDSLESYARPQFQHHGIPSFSLNDESLVQTVAISERAKKQLTGVISKISSAETHYHARLTALRDFLDSLLCWDLDNNRASANFYDSYICVSIGIPIGRHDGPSKALKSMIALADRYRTSGLPHVEIHVHTSTDYVDLGISSSEVKDSCSLGDCGVLPVEWQPAKHKNGSSEIRLEAFMTLKLQLQAIQLVDSEAERSHYVNVFQRDIQCRDAMLGVLSIFRRARSIACIRSMTERWLIGVEAGASASQLNAIRRAIDGLLNRQVLLGTELCTDKPFGMLHEGASVWLFREVQTAWYRSMTASLSVSSWILRFFSRPEKNRQKYADDAVQTIIDGLVCVSLHIEASRVYYAYIFMPTRDLEAFYEYLYHRCWSIRTLSLIMAILKADFGTEEPFKKAIELFERTRNAVADSMKSRHCIVRIDRSSPFSELGIFASVSELIRELRLDDKRGFQKALEILQEHCVETLVGALHRQETFLLHHATPETLDGWLVQMKQIVLPEMDGTLLGPFIGLRGSMRSQCQSFSQLEAFVDRLDQRIKRQGAPTISSPKSDLESVQEAEKIAKQSQEEAAFLWSVLDNIEEMRPWHFERSLAKVDRQVKLQPFYDSRTLAWKYESTLRRTMRDIDLDSRHRSCALAMLARSEYLIGHFRQAQRRLDLAGGGLTNSPMHRASRSLIHAYRAELLIYSAEDHYVTTIASRPVGELQWLDVMKELRKVNRADREIRRACSLIEDAENLSRWRSLWNLGLAQIQLERLLYESEAIFVRRRPITPKEYSEMFGCFEQTLLDGLKALRTSLDEMPFFDLKYDNAKKMACPRTGIKRQRFFEFKVESKVWGLWRQFYVVAAYFDSLLNLFSTTPILTGSTQSYQGDCIRILNLVSEGTEAFSYDRWRNWNQSVRFEDFATIGRDYLQPDSTAALPRADIDSQMIRDDSRGSLRRVQTLMMARDVSEEKIRSMWNRRRKAN